MIRVFLPLLVLVAGGCGPEPDPTRTFVGTSSEGTTGPTPTHHLTWQLDGEAATEMDIFDQTLHVSTASGAGCSASVLVYVSDGRPSGDSANVRLYFPEPPAPGVEAPLPAAERPDPNDPFAPYFVPVSIDAYFLGGTVTVDAFDDTKWSFRFDGLSDCTTNDTCTPVGGATLVIEPLPYLDMPKMSSTPCIAASAFPWPDSWDGCAVTTGSFDEGVCPSPMPW